MAATSHSYSAGKFLLELDGKAAGFLMSVEGGEPSAVVAANPAGPNGVVSKQRTGVRYAPIQISFGLAMSKAFYQWIAATLDRNGTIKNGVIVFVDFNYVEVSRLAFDQGVITEVKFPALDASAKDAASMSITIQPEVTRTTTSGAGARVSTVSAKFTKRWSPDGFRLKISGLEGPCAKVNKIDAIVVTQEIKVELVGINRVPTVTRGILAVPNVSFTLAESSSKDFYTWADEFVVNGNGAERSGSIEFLGADLKTSLFTLNLSNLGLIRVRKNRSEAGAEVISRVNVEMYCESMSFSATDDVIGSAPAATTAAAPAAPPRSTTDLSVTETLLAIINGKITAQDALRSTLIMQSTELTPLTGTTQPELVARRLLATTKPSAAVTTVPKRDTGVAIGTQWATENATLGELKEVAALDGGDWTAVGLRSEHTLITHLVDAGHLPKGADGPIDLERDAFVEGIVFGAAQVFRGAAQHLDAPALKA